MLKVIRDTDQPILDISLPEVASHGVEKPAHDDEEPLSFGEKVQKYQSELVQNQKRIADQTERFNAAKEVNDRAAQYQARNN